MDLSHTDIGEDAHRVDALREMGSGERLAAGVEGLRLAGAETVVWACTSGSFVHGWEGAQQQVQDPGPAGRDAGLLDVLRLRARGPRDRRTPGRDRRHLPGGHHRPVRGLPAGRRPGGDRNAVLGVVTAAEAGTWGEEDVLTLARAADTPDAEAVLLPDTALHTAAHLGVLEKSLSKPVLTANQVTVWEGLRLADRRVNAPSLGTLFTREPLVQARRDTPGAPAE